MTRLRPQHHSDQCTAREVDSLFGALDISGDGELDYEELYRRSALHSSVGSVRFGAGAIA